MKTMKHLKKWGLALASLCIVVLPIFGNVDANDDFDTAEPLLLNATASGDLSPSNDYDYYAVQLPEDGSLTIHYTGVIDGLTARIRIYNSVEGHVGSSVVYGESGTFTGHCLAADLYYVIVERNGNSGTYTIVATADSYGTPSDQEPNNSIGEALQTFNAGEEIHGHLGHTGQYPGFFGYDGNDYFLIETERDGDITLSVEPENGLSVRLRILRPNGSLLQSSGTISESGSITATCQSQGTYIARIERLAGCGSYTATYEVPESTFANDVEPNSSLGEIQELFHENQTATGHLGYTDINAQTDARDYYHIVKPRDGDLTIQMDVDSSLSASIKLYYKTGSYIGGSATGTGTVSYTVSCMAADTLVVLIERSSGCGSYGWSFVSPALPYAHDSEPNNSRLTINTVVDENVEATGHLGYSDSDTGTDSHDFFHIVKPRDGDLNIQMDVDSSLSASIKLYYKTGSYIGGSAAGTGAVSFTVSCLAADTLVVLIERSSGCGAYSWSFVSPALPDANDSEPNNTRLTINTVVHENVEATGHLGFNDSDTGTDSHDFFHIVKPRDGDLTIHMDVDLSLYASVKLYYKNGSFLANSPSNTGAFSYTVSCVAADTLVVLIERNSGCGSYRWNYDSPALEFADDVEPNNSLPTINTVVPENQVVTGHLGFYDIDSGTDTDDYFKIVAPGDGDVTVYVTMNPSLGGNVQLYYKTGSYISGSASNVTGSFSHTRQCLGADTLIVKIQRNSGCGSYSMYFETTPPAYATDAEPNDTRTTATPSLNYQINQGHLGYATATGTDTYDYYSIQVNDVPFDLEARVELTGTLVAGLVLENGNGGFILSTPQYSAGEHTLTHTLETPGTYYIRMNRNSGCGSYTLGDFCGTAPDVTAMVLGPAFICPGGEAVLQATPDLFGYIWYKDGEEFAYTQNITVNLPGVYQVLGYDENTCGGLSETIVIQQYAIPELVVNPSGQTTFCEGESITLTASSGFDSYLWNTGQTGNSITVTESDEYSVLATTADGCTVGSETISVMVHDVPELLVNANGDLNFCLGGEVTLTASSGFDSYVWNTGSTDESITVTESGEFFVSATTVDGCIAVSSSVVVNVCTDGECAPDCFGIYGGDGIVDDCGECRTGTSDPDYNSTCTDCNGDVNGTAYLDGCGTCVGGNTGLEPCGEDCFGVAGGDGIFDDCGVCRHGESDPDYNSTCVDCNGEVNGTAYFDDCGTCVGGNTGLEPCGEDCFGVAGGDGILDDCGICRHGESDPDYNSTCVDCNGEVNGTAYFDDCGTCVGGNTGLEPCGEDCFGVAGGDGILDDCGICRHGESDPDYNSTCVDCNGEVNGTAYYDDCGTCVGGNTGLEPCGEDCFGVAGGDGILDDCGVCRHGESDPDYNSTCVDCNGEVNGTAYFDDCGTCVGGNTGLEPCGADCFGIAGGDGILDDCGVCRHGESDPDYNSSCEDCAGVPNGPALPGTPCEVDGSFGTYNDWCECIPETGECAFDYFLSSANDAGGTDIFRMHLNDENGTADLELLNSVDEPVSIAYHAAENQLYLISHGQPAYRVMDAGTGDLTPKTSYNYNAHGFTAAAFGPDGILYVGSESKQKVFAYNPQTHSIVDRTPAPVVGGDLAVGNDGEVYMVSRAPHILGIVNFNGPNEFIRYITYNAAGLALTSDGNLLLAIDGRKNVMVGTTDGDDTGIRYNYMYNGQPYFVLHADLASGCPDDVPVATALRAPNTIEAEAAADNRVELASSPNPTSDISNVWFNAAQPETVVLEVFDLNGRNIATLYNGNAEGGLTYRFQFDGSGLPNGIYLYRLTTERGVQIEKFMIAR